MKPTGRGFGSGCTAASSIMHGTFHPAHRQILVVYVVVGIIIVSTN